MEESTSTHFDENLMVSNWTLQRFDHVLTMSGEIPLEATDWSTGLEGAADINGTKVNAHTKYNNVNIDELSCDDCGCERSVCFMSLHKHARSATIDLIRYFNCLSPYHKKQHVLNRFWESGNKVGKCNFVVGGISICRNAWLVLVGMSNSAFYRIRKLFLENTKIIPISDMKLGTLCPKTKRAMAWLESYAEKTGCKMPDNNSLNLPSCLTKGEVYKLCRDDQLYEWGECISESHFLHVWRTHLERIKIPPVMRFSKCDQCILLRNHIWESKTCTEKKIWVDRRMAHLELQSKERMVYYQKIESARKEPDKFLSMIIDGMDQNKTAIPHFYEDAKSTAKFAKLKCHLTGVIVHGRGSYAFFDTMQYPHDPNLTIHVILSTLSMMTQIPDTLYLQLDNCGRENKNRYVFGFLSWLVVIGIFKSVEVSFLMVGHTHEDIDQMFSRFAVWLRRHPAYTLDELMIGYEKCIENSTMTAIRTDEVYDYRNWIADCIDEIANHSLPHSFRFALDSNNRPTVSYKNWSSDSEWIEVKDQLLLKRPGPDLPPAIIPSWVKAQPDLVERDLPKMAKFFPKGENYEGWWNQFFADTVNAAVEDTMDDRLNNILLSKATYQRSIEDHVTLDEPALAPPPPVIIGRRKRKRKRTE